MLAKHGYTETTSESLKAPGSVGASYEGVARAAFSLDASVSFVLEPEAGYSAKDFTFRVGNAYADVKDVNGYIFVTVKAYRITDTLSWTLTDKDDASITYTGEFSLATYYASETVQKSPTLLHLIERLAAFSEAADALVNF